jgi:hypothetical protein
LGIEHHNFYETVKKYQDEVSNDFGKVLFVSEPLPSGQKQAYALLTEEQAYVYLAYSQNTAQARACKRLLVKALAEARARLRQLEIEVWAPAPKINELWEHLLLLFNKQTQIPAGYWCIFNEIAHVFWSLEEFKGVHVHEHAVPDISVGKLWMKEVRRLGLDESLIRQYPHHYPDQRGVQYANMYPNAWLGAFRNWFEHQYLKHEFLDYLKAHTLVLPESEAKKLLK